MSVRAWLPGGLLRLLRAAAALAVLVVMARLRDGRWQAVGGAAGVVFLPDVAGVQDALVADVHEQA